MKKILLTTLLSSFIWGARAQCSCGSSGTLALSSANFNSALAPTSSITKYCISGEVNCSFTTDPAAEICLNNGAKWNLPSTNANMPASTITNNAGATVNSAKSNIFFTINNSGTYEETAGTSLQMGAVFNNLNSGNIGPNGLIILTGAVFTNAANAKVNITTIFVQGVLNNNGIILINAGNLTLLDPGTIINNGGIELNTGNVLLLNNTSVSGTLGQNGYIWALVGSISNSTTLSNVQLVSGDPNAFPVKILNFRTNNQFSGIELSWKAIEALNFDRFFIERANDAQNFERIGAVKFNKNGDFSFLDSTPLTGNNYYRLASRNNDGTVAYSSILRVFYSDKEPYAYLENPVVSNDISIISNVGNLSIQLFAISGRPLGFRETKTNLGYNIRLTENDVTQAIMRLSNGSFDSKKRLLLLK